MTSLSTSRADRFEALNRVHFDLLVIGGGVTGCGIARDAALRGLSVALVEKNDFASGTSSRSSRLIHGGVRYLEHGQLHLVFESSAERRRLLRMAPHLVRPLQFTWPVYEGARIPRWKLDAGLMLYDALALFRNVGRHRRLNARDVLEHEPMLRPDGLLGGARYYDAATNDARLTLANALSAAEAGAVVVNHAAVTTLRSENGRVIGARVRDTLGARTADVTARVVVNATGPWSDELRHLDPSIASSGRPAVRGSKGAHVAVPRERVGNTYALTLTSPRDGRVMFVLPADTHAIIGTTDTYTSSSPDSVHASNEDVRYLIDSANAFFPAARLTTSDVVSAWAGIRPLVPSSGDTPGGASREHAITTSADGLVSITGGKLTTYRVMAADVVHVVLRRLGLRAGRDLTKTVPLFGGDFSSINDLIASAVRATNDIPFATHLVSSFGSRWPAVLAEINTGDGRTVVADGLPYTIGELRYSLREEMATTLGDLFVRRTHLAFETRDHGIAAAERAVRALGGDAKEIEGYAGEVERIFSVSSA
ncbi:MAG: glycerol-3-phosphate dehydrogenase [Gemmatimonadetes bacterium]|nr:glycerol-3-phosphate dehydrogenase [Gemmatimonadota bacterium]